MPGILGKKLGMTQVFEENGNLTPVTVVSCPPSEITQVKTPEKDGYAAVVLGFEPLKKPRKTRKFRFLREFRVEKVDDLKVGDSITVEAFKDTKEVVVTGISKGKGFAGFIKRHHFSSGPGGHGSHHKREPGSIGARAKPGRVLKGKRMAGHMGTDRVTLQHIPLVEVNSEKNYLMVKGPVPGPTGGLILIKS